MHVYEVEREEKGRMIQERLAYLAGIGGGDTAINTVGRAEGATRARHGDVGNAECIIGPDEASTNRDGQVIAGELAAARKWTVASAVRASDFPRPGAAAARLAKRAVATVKNCIL